jgi:3-deoxy-D-manno-octulosonic-acid transferase
MRLQVYGIGLTTPTPLSLYTFVPLHLFYTFEHFLKNMRIFYNLGIVIYGGLVMLTAPFSKKARLWVSGRKGWLKVLREKIIPGEKYIWVHCASLGEFEQGRPIIESLRKEKPEYRILLTFFSPSGYEIRKNYQMADIVCYLPADTPRNARMFLDTANPALALFVKYEFWDNYISGLKARSIPVYLVSGIFRESQHFFRWYGRFFRDILKKFTWIFLQDQTSFKLLQGLGISNITIAGDTRFDRVAEIASQAKVIPELGLFRNGEKLFLAGSSWKPDEEIIVRYINENPDRMKWVFAPHEPEPENIERLEKMLATTSVRFSRIDNDSAKARVLIIDNMGMLSSAYKYSSIAAVGGGFGRGIHNILEPACWGIPILFGPNYHKFREAIDLTGLEAAKSFNDYDSFKSVMNALISDETAYKKAGSAAAAYVDKNRGATSLIVREIV